MDTDPAAVLAALRADFPGYCLWKENTQGGTRYIARSLSLRQSPHTLVTADPAELRAALAAARTTQPPA